MSRHGREQCQTCHTISYQCCCFEDKKAPVVSFHTCPKCKADQAYETCKRTYELNQKLKALGVSALSDDASQAAVTKE